MGRHGRTLASVVVSSEQVQAEKIGAEWVAETSSSSGFPPPGFENQKGNYLPITHGRPKNNGHIHALHQQTSSWPAGFWLFIHNLPPFTSNHYLENILSATNEVISSAVSRAPNHRGKWFGFLLLTNQRALQASINFLNGRVVDGYKLLSVKAWKRPFPDFERYSINNNLWKKAKTLEEKLEPLFSLRGKEPRGSIVSSQFLELQKSHLVILHSNLTVESVLRELALDGIYEISLKSLGCGLAILYCSDPAFDAELVKDKGSWMRKWLTFLPDSKHLCLKGGFFNWYSIKGLPFQAWCDESFHSCLSSIGDFVYAHPQTTQGNNFESALVIGHSRTPPSSSLVCNIILGPLTYPVLVSSLDLSSVPSTHHLETNATGSSDMASNHNKSLVSSPSASSEEDLSEPRISQPKENLGDNGNGNCMDSPALELLRHNSLDQLVGGDMRNVYTTKGLTFIDKEENTQVLLSENSSAINPNTLPLINIVPQNSAKGSREDLQTQASEVLGKEDLGIDRLFSGRKDILKVGAFIDNTITTTTVQSLDPQGFESDFPILEGKLPIVSLGVQTPNLTKVPATKSLRKTTKKPITYAYATRSKKGLIVPNPNHSSSSEKNKSRGKKIITGETEAQKCLSYCKALGLKACVADDLVIEQFEALDDELNQRVLFDSESEEDYVDLEDDFDPALEDDGLLSH